VSGSEITTGAKSRREKAAEGQPDSMTLARGPQTPQLLAELLECAFLFWRFCPVAKVFFCGLIREVKSATY